MLQKSFQKLEYKDIINIAPDQLSQLISTSVNSILGDDFPYKIGGVLVFDIEPADAAAVAAIAEEAKAPIARRKDELESEIRKEKRGRQRDEEIDEIEYKRRLEQNQLEFQREMTRRDEEHRNEKEKRELEHKSALRAQELNFSETLDQRELQHALNLAYYKAVEQAKIFKIESQARREVEGLDADEHLRIESQRLVQEIERLQHVSQLPDEPSRIVALLGADNYIKLEDMAKEVQIAQASGNHQRYSKVLGYALSAAQAQGKGQAFLEVLNKYGVIDRSQIDVDVNFSDLDD